MGIPGPGPGLGSGPRPSVGRGFLIVPGDFARSAQCIDRGERGGGVRVCMTRALIVGVSW